MPPLPRQCTSGDARNERMGIWCYGRYINDDTPDGPEPGRSTIAHLSLVAAEQMRMLVRYAIGEDWWHRAAIPPRLSVNGVP